MTEYVAARQTTPHYNLVRDFMEQAEQALPDEPGIPSEAVRLTRARLIWEECIKELVTKGLAVDMTFEVGKFDGPVFSIATDRQPDLVEIADGCADAKVVVTGTLIACGLTDELLQVAVDQSNLRKFVVPKCNVHNIDMVHEGGGRYCCPHVGPKDRNHDAFRCTNFDRGPYLNDAGKWIKPPDWTPPDIAGIIEQMRRR